MNKSQKKKMIQKKITVLGPINLALSLISSSFVLGGGTCLGGGMLVGFFGSGGLILTDSVLIKSGCSTFGSIGTSFSRFEVFS